MKIAFDWDDTISKDPETFGKVISLLMDAGHEMRIVTWRKEPAVDSSGFIRYEDMDAEMSKWDCLVPVVYCNGQAKRELWSADVWVDDNPAAVLMTLAVDPRIVEDPSEYDEDTLLLKLDGEETLPIKWKYLKP